MANKVQLPGSIKLEQININVPKCPGCNREHDLTPRVPNGMQNCGRGFGTFIIKIVNRSGYLEVEVQFQDTHYNLHDISKEVVVTVRAD